MGLGIFGCSFFNPEKVETPSPERVFETPLITDAPLPTLNPTDTPVPATALPTEVPTNTPAPTTNKPANTPKPT